MYEIYRYVGIEETSLGERQALDSAKAVIEHDLTTFGVDVNSFDAPFDVRLVRRGKTGAVEAWRLLAGKYNDMLARYEIRRAGQPYPIGMDAKTYSLYLSCKQLGRVIEVLEDVARLARLEQRDETESALAQAIGELKELEANLALMAGDANA